MLHRLLAVVEPGLDRLAKHLGKLEQRVHAEVAPRHVRPQRQRQPGLEQPPLAEVDDLLQAFTLVRELALVDQETRVGSPGQNLLADLVERHRAVTEVC